jgi:hypothetical protein
MRKDPNLVLQVFTFNSEKMWRCCSEEGNGCIHAFTDLFLCAIYYLFSVIKVLSIVSDYLLLAFLNAYLQSKLKYIFIGKELKR